MKKLTCMILGLALCLADAAADERPRAQSEASRSEWSGRVTDAAQLPVERNEWGTLQWLCNGKLMPGSTQTVGLATILPVKQNPVHYHPNCDELLYVISGEGVQSYDGRSIRLKAGMTIRIPAKVKHNLSNTGTEPLQTLVSFSSGIRKTVWLRGQPAK
jgi:mannose-6-phosphate isomerase-like protein (cupin superfamily)